MMITKTHLPRRTFLRGVGATLALPLLDGMVPAFTPLRLSAAAPVKRLGVVYVPNGVLMDQWTPDATGTGFELKPVMESLAPHRDTLTVLGGLANKHGDALPGEGAGDHARAAGAFLTGVHPKKTAGADIRAGVSMDQIAARELEQETQLASLELSLDSKEPLGACDPGYSCVYANTLNWRSETTPLPMENNPRVRLRTAVRRQRDDRPGGAHGAHAGGRHHPGRRRGKARQPAPLPRRARSAEAG